MSTDIKNVEYDKTSYEENARRERVRRNADMVVGWPEDDFYHDDVDDWGALRSFAQQGIVETHRGDDGRMVYSVPDHYRAIAEQSVEERNAICPCGHAGVVNQGDYYECAFDQCDREFEREELNA